MIKIIHQIWIGPDIPKRFIENSLGIETINSDYLIIRWDEIRLLEEFPDIKLFLDLECVPTFITNWARFRILQKYGGWYIDYDFTAYDTLDSLFKEEHTLISSEFTLPGYSGTSGFIYMDKNLNYTPLLEYVPDVPTMPLFNTYLKNNRHYLIPGNLVSEHGVKYKEERMRSFYSHKNFYMRIKKSGDKYILKRKD